ncbi:MAG: class II fructose-bisphosphate aldolase [Clostridia bacterium]|nr:class II fructose-bisphosphate aldolase [Clostridia bacterium]
MKDLKYYLAKAKDEDFALGAINFSNMETLQSIVNATNKLNSPAIIAVSESSFSYIGNFLPYLSSAAKEGNSSLFLHLDHGKSFDICKKAIDMGFDSVMIDASDLPFEENVALTAKVCQYAHSKKVLVEGELGQIKGTEDGASSYVNHFTSPNQAKDFVERTGVDMLAISIGTSHGIYKHSGRSLRFDILDAIEKAIPDTPLVLHGASSVDKSLIEKFQRAGGQLEQAGGIPLPQLSQAIANHHIAKINTDTDIRLTFTSAIREQLKHSPRCFDPRKYLAEARQQVEDLITFKIEHIFNSKNKREC